MRTHTPGPWSFTIRTQKSPCCGAIASSIGYVRATDHREIAALYAREEQEANARLIAASPELLAACRLALPALERENDLHGRMPYHEELDALIAAIAKAEGAQ